MNKVSTSGLFLSAVLTIAVDSAFAQSGSTQVRIGTGVVDLVEGCVSYAISNDGVDKAGEWVKFFCEGDATSSAAGLFSALGRSGVKADEGTSDVGNLVRTRSLNDWGAGYGHCSQRIESPARRSDVSGYFCNLYLRVGPILNQ